MDCHISFDIGATTGLLSQLTGVLAGFSFTAVVISMSRALDGRSAGQTPAPDSVKESLDRAMPVMVCSFLALVVTSVSYSAISGDAANAGRAATEELVCTLAASVSTILMFYSIVLLLEVAEAWDAAGHGRRVLGQFVTLLSFGYICNGLSDYNDVRFRDGAQPPGWEMALIYGSFCVYALYAVAGYFLYHRLPRIGGRGVTRNRDGQITTPTGGSYTAPDHTRIVQRIATGCLLTVIACAVGVGFYSAYGGNACGTPSPGVTMTIAGAGMAVTLASSVWLFLSRGPDPEG
ncbi:hypothetical protein [Streptomyces adustus]|uniref:hypothetical protein n=1 Tax=Streptomyces adustus TaxID=1609272 RepID=UPI0037182336